MAIKEGTAKMIGCWFLGAIFFLVPIVASAQDFPTRPINVLVSYGPGGTSDIAFRALANATEKILGRPLVITNNGAAAGTAALGIVARQKPDGYNLGVTSSGLFNFIPHLRSTIPYKPDDFVPVTVFGVTQNVLVVKAGAPWKTLKDFVQDVRKDPGKGTYFSGGTASPLDLNVQQVARSEKVEFTQVPFSGGAAGLNALLGGHINMLGGGGACVTPARAGQARIVAVMATTRMKEFPDAPSYADLGYKPVPADVFLVFAPKGVAPAIIRKLDESFAKGMKDPVFLQTLEKFAVLGEYSSSEAAKKFLGDSYGTMGKLIKEYNIPKED